MGSRRKLFSAGMHKAAVSSLSLLAIPRRAYAIVLAPLQWACDIDQLARSRLWSKGKLKHWIYWVTFQQKSNWKCAELVQPKYLSGRPDINDLETITEVTVTGGTA